MLLSVKCCPTIALSTPLELLPWRPAFHEHGDQCRTRLPLLSRLTKEPSVPCRSPPSARRARAVVAGREEVGLAAPMAAAAVLAGAHLRHAIFREELVRRAYYTAEAAHMALEPAMLGWSPPKFS
ncbi:hypothetical protein ZWY2020_038799 [Hordeum vulgare]|nr:hypothetical protein ZWY2020_038799 [Hordeum vulgare]